MANTKATTGQATASDPTRPVGGEVLPSLAQLHLQLDATSRVAMDRGVEITRAMNEMTRHNLDTMFALSQVATSGFGEIATQLSKFAVNQASEGSSYGRDLAGLQSPGELMAFHEARTRRVSEAMIGEVSALSEKLTAVSSTMMATLQTRSAAALEQTQAILHTATSAVGPSVPKAQDSK